MSEILNDVQALTSTIPDAQTKGAYLRSVVAASLMKFNYAEEEIEAALNQFFQERTLQ
jgi:type II secretory pathway component PulM